MNTFETQLHRFRWIILSILTLAAATSLFVGIRGAIASSKDFQWAGAWLLRAGIDPWQQTLADGGHGIAHFSPPNYLHEFYIMLLPLSLVTFEHAAEIWCAVTILLSIATMYLLKNLFALSTPAALGLLLLLWMSTPFRTTLQVGQMGMMEMFLLSVVFCTTNSTLRGLALGFSFSKYTFAPVLVSFLWFKRNIRTLTIAATVPLLALIMTWGLLGGPISTLATEPFAVSRIKVWPGMADLMTAIEATFAHLVPSFTHGKTLAYIVGLAASGCYGYFLSRRRITNAAQLTLIAVASIFTVKHLMYDYVFLVIPLCYALSERGRALRNIAVPLIFVFWFMDKLFPLLPMNAAPSTAQWLTSIAGCIMLGTLLTYLTWSILRIERAFFASRTRAEKKAAIHAEALSAA
jgi:Glycosyltransferase family 87